MVIVLNRVYLTFMLINLISRLNMGASNIEKLTPLFTTKFTKKSVTFASSTSHWCSCETTPLVPVWIRAKSFDHLDTFSVVHNVALGEIHLFDQEIHLGWRSCIKVLRYEKGERFKFWFGQVLRIQKSWQKIVPFNSDNLKLLIWNNTETCYLCWVGWCLTKLPGKMG